MICIFERFDGSLLAHSASIPYKYIIYSPKSISDSNPYEYLHGYGNTDFNRCLLIPNDGVKMFYRGICRMILFNNLIHNNIEY